jgi:hypothetical protein
MVNEGEKKKTKQLSMEAKKPVVLVVSLGKVGKSTIIHLLSDSTSSTILEVLSLQTLARMEKRSYAKYLHELNSFFRIDLVIWIGTATCFCTRKPLFSDLSVDKFLRDSLGENATKVGRLAIINKVPCEDKKPVPIQKDVL